MNFIKKVVSSIKSSLKFVYSIILGIFVGAGIVFLFGLDNYLNNDNYSIEIDTSSYYTENRHYELEIVRDDLITYGRSEKVSKIITDTIEEVTKDYDLPIGLLHAIFRVESDYKFNITHPTVTVPVHGRGVTTNAAGLGGIVWVYWGDSLRSKGIAETELDLYLPDVNVRASGYVLRYLIDDEMKRKNLSEINILDNVIKRYYGAYSPLYLSKMERVTSDLWMKRIAKELIKK